MLKKKKKRLPTSLLLSSGVRMWSLELGSHFVTVREGKEDYSDFSLDREPSAAPVSWLYKKN